MKDYSKAEFQIFFSGVESDRYFEIVTNETNAVLMSYLYVKRKGKTFLSKRVAEKPDLRLMLDSGVHTFLSKFEEYEKKTVEWWENYLEEYTAFIRANKDHIFAAVELDIVSLLADPTLIDKWREKYFKPLEEEGIQIIYVWHSEEGQAQWEKMCKQFSYVAFSMQGDRKPDDSTCIRMLNTAKRYGTRVHGLAATGMDSMQKLPFFTVDSTTWLVGTQFGEVNFFDGRSMKRLKKDKWKRQYKNKLIQLGANWTLAEREEPYELIRINVLTFLQVEAYLRKFMKNKAYWLQGGHKTVSDAPKITREVKDFSEVSLPSREWFDGEMEDFKDYAEELGIDINLDKESIICWLEFFFAFLNNDKEIIEASSDEEIFKLVDLFGLKSSCNTRKKALEMLPVMFREHACGNRHELENYAEVLARAGEAPPHAKEREEYLEEKTHVTVEVPKEEVIGVLRQFLPEGKNGEDMPEVEKYDEELKSVGIVPVRDESGKLLKGQKTVRKPKQVYSDLMPKLSCDTCIKAGSCPDYQVGFVCAYNKLFKRFDSRNTDDVEDAIASMVNHNLQRMQQQMIFEMLDGGIADPNVTGLIDQNIKLLSLMQNMKQNQRAVVATRKVVIDNEGKPTEVVETVSANPQHGGILSKLFGGTQTAVTKEEEDIETIDADVVKKD